MNVVKPFASALLAIAGLSAVNAGASDASISNGIANAFGAASKGALKQAWSGKIYRFNVSSLDRTPLSPEDAFQLTKGCDVTFKQDNGERYKASVGWSCKGQAIAGKPCSYRTVSADVFDWTYYGDGEALYVSEYEDYDAKKCGTPSQPSSPKAELDAQ